MPKRRLFWQLFPSYVAVTVVALVLVGWYMASRADSLLLQQIETDLTARAHLIAAEMSDKLGDSPADLQKFCRRLGDSSDTRITIIIPPGRVIADSESDPAPMEDHADRPEIKHVVGGGDVGQSIRYSPTLHKQMMYVAVPIEGGGGPIAVARVALPLESVNAELRDMYRIATAGGIIAGVVASVLALFVSRRITRPLVEMRKGAERFAKGDLHIRLARPSTVELAGLADTLNAMAADLAARIEAVTRQRSEQEAILTSMREGVIAIDAGRRIISMNRSAADIINLGQPLQPGRDLASASPSIAFTSFLSDTLASTEPLESDITVSGPGERHLQLHGAPLLDSSRRRIGAVIVLNDITRLRRLENVRRDFVANVSHELKTPITSIKGFVETLQSGALADPAEAKRFLDIIAHHADRLNGIIDDLLLLSRIEQNAERSQVELSVSPIREIIDAAANMCSAKAAEKNIQFEIDCPDDVKAAVNEPLLEQAIVNLLDNAVKYSGPGSSVAVCGEIRMDEVVISVRDCGCGVPPEHLERIFERFYRVDKARSRELGGTGLGLAIVKHIVHAHHGTVTVESRPDEGSMFAIHLPAPPAA